MSDPLILYRSRCQVWVASIDPPWFLGFIYESNGEGGRK